jgi:hypothetical protein
MKKEPLVITLALFVEFVRCASSYRTGLDRYRDEPRTQTFENAAHTATVNVMPYFQFGGALIELEGPQFRVVSSTGGTR